MRREVTLRVTAGLLAGLLAGCSVPGTTATGPAGPGEARSWAAPPVAHQVSVRDGRSGERLGFEELLERLAAAQVVFLGETHTDETTHRAQLAIYEGLLERRDGRVVLALEMFERDVQPALDAYLQGRGGELIEELPLFRVENQGYIHYRKGSLVTYAIRDYIGEEAFNAAMFRYVRDLRFTGPPYTTSLEYLDYLEPAVPPEYESIVEDLFRTITLWDFQAKEGEWERTEDGRYLVRMTVEARKYRADGQGVETEIPMDDWVDVAVFGEETEDSPEEGRVLAMEKRRVSEAEGVIEILVDEEPRQVGIDPFNKLIDRNPGNNLVRVREVGG